MTVGQLYAAGLDKSAVARLVRAGQQHRVYRGVYAVGHAGLAREGRILAAVLWAGKGAALGHLSAAEHLEVRKYRASLIDVAVPARRRSPQRVRVHETRSLHPRDVTIYKGIPVTKIARTLVDLTDVLTPYPIANLIHEAAYRHLFSERATRDAMRRANGRHRICPSRWSIPSSTARRPTSTGRLTSSSSRSTAQATTGRAPDARTREGKPRGAAADYSVLRPHYRSITAP